MNEGNIALCSLMGKANIYILFYCACSCIL